MKESTQSHRRVGVWSAVTMVMIGVAYIIVGAIGVMARSPSPDPLHEDDPYLAILEFLIVLSAVALVSMMAAVYGYSPPSTKTYSLVSLAFMVVLAVLTSSVHFASLTVGRQIESGAMPQLYRQLSFEQWPSVALALDFLAWDFFLGLSLLSAAAVFKGDRLHTNIRITMIVAGSLCIAGTLGPLLGQLRIALLATVGYAFVLPVICVLLAILFARPEVTPVAE